MNKLSKTVKKSNQKAEKSVKNISESCKIIAFLLFYDRLIALRISMYVLTIHFIFSMWAYTLSVVSCASTCNVSGFLYKHMCGQSFLYSDHYIETALLFGVDYQLVILAHMTNTTAMT